MWIVCGLCLVSLFVFCRAAPTSKESSSNERGMYFDNSRQKFSNDSVCVSDDVLYNEDDVIPTASTCERCVCRPPDIACEVINCEIKSGCRPIQLPNKCCPEYKCECEADGRVYQNGERLDDPNSPCRVCYCQSGEIVCTVIKCYTREDCTPRYVTGKCCPKYDHCPPVDPTPLTFYTTAETSSESTKYTSVGFETPTAESSDISQDSIQDNTVDTYKWAELVDEKYNSPMSRPDMIGDHGKDVSLTQTSAERSGNGWDDRNKLHKVNAEVHAESTIVGETSKTEGSYKAKLQEDSTDILTDSTGNGEESKGQDTDKEGLKHSVELYGESTDTGGPGERGNNGKLELQRDNTEVYKESTGMGGMSKRGGVNKEELIQYNSEAYSESTGTEERDKIEGNDKEELQNNSEVYTEGAVVGVTRAAQGSDKGEEQVEMEVYTESTGAAEKSKKEGSNTNEMQKDSTGLYTESTGTGQKFNAEVKDREELQENAETYVGSTRPREISKIGGNDREEGEDNTESYTESINTGKSNKLDRNDQEVEDNTESYTESTGTGETSKTEEHNKEMQQDNTDIDAAVTETGHASKKERTDKEELQQDDTEVYVESTSSGETRGTETYNKEELQEFSTKEFTESMSSSVPTQSSGEDKTTLSPEKIINKTAEAWFDESATTQSHHILLSEKEKTNGKLDEEVSSPDLTKTEDNGMVKDDGAVWYMGEFEESSTESVTFETPQETEKHEITRNIRDHNERDSVTDPTWYETSVKSTEATVTGSSGGDEKVESLTSSGKIDQGKYNEDNTEADNTESSGTTTNEPDRHTELTEHESKDKIPVVTFQSNMELHHMDLVVPGLETAELQVDDDIKTTEINPVSGVDSEVKSITGYSAIANGENITYIGGADDVNASGLDDKTFQNSSEESEIMNNSDESSTSSLTSSTADLTTNPTIDITSELQNTERTESSEPTPVKSETVYSTKIHLAVASLLMHDNATKTQNEEITRSTVGSTTPDVLEGEHPLNVKESEQLTEQTEATLQDVAAASPVRDNNNNNNNNNVQDIKAVSYPSDEGASHTEPTRGSVAASDLNTAPAHEPDGSILFTAGDTKASEKILGSVSEFRSNKTDNTTETSDVLPKEWLKTHQVTTVTNPDAVHMDEDKSQTVFNVEKAEELTSTVNYSNDESTYLHESESEDRTDQPKETDTINTESATDSSLTTSINLENTDKFDDYPPSKENSAQILANDFSNERQSTKENSIDNASEELEAISTTSNYISNETEMPFKYNLFSQQHNKKQNEMEVSDNSATDVLPHGDPGLAGGDALGGPRENESLISDAVKNAPSKEPNKFDKNYLETISTENNSTYYDPNGSDEPVIVKKVQSPIYSSSSYEINSHDFYGIGDYYVSSSESGLTFNTTDVSSETTSTATSPSSAEEYEEPITITLHNDHMVCNGHEHTYSESTVTPTETGATNRTEIALESTTQGLLENVHHNGEIANFSEINIKNSLEDNQNAESLDTELNENVDALKFEPALYGTSDSHQENYSIW